ncbi:MAG: hypothetical protein LBU23_02775 [Planctomycetota bacterium]|jgi:hypothetical protein|nr:hypothetical protein [Planctomycetota bacterium]
MDSKHFTIANNSVPRSSPNVDQEASFSARDRDASDFFRPLSHTPPAGATPDLRPCLKPVATPTPGIREEAA